MKSVAVLKRIVVILFSVYMIALAVLAYFQRSFLYFPTPSVQHGMKEIDLHVKEATLKVIVLNEGRKKAILYFGGNAEVLAGNIASFGAHFKDHTLYLAHYRGYGGSSGVPTEQSLYEDALVLYDIFKKSHDEVAVVGRSIGSGVATYLASKRDVKKLVLITPFDSVEKLAQERFPIFPIGLILQDKYDSLSRAGSIRAHVCILIAQKDEIVPNENSIRLYRGFDPAKVSQSVFEDVGHNDIHRAKAYFSTIEHFLM